MREYLSSENITYYEGKLWFTEIDNNNIYSYDINTKQCLLFCTVDNEKKEGKRLFGSISIQDGFLYLFPFSAVKIYKIHLETKNIIEIDIEIPDKDIHKNYCSEAKFFSSYSYKDKIWVLPASYPAILEYRIKDETIIYHKKWVSDVYSFINVKDENAFFRKTEIVQDKLYAPLCGGNAVLIYDISCNKYEIQRVGDKNCNYASICYDGEYFWLIPRNNGVIVRWDIKSNKYNLYNNFPENLQSNKGRFNDIIYFENHIIILPGNIGTVLEVNRETGNIEILYPELQNFYNASHCKGNGKIYISSTMGGWITISEDIKKPLFKRIQKPFSSVQNDFFSKIFYENVWELLDEYILCIVEEKEILQQKNQEKDIIGKIVWKTLNENTNIN